MLKKHFGFEEKQTVKVTVNKIRWIQNKNCSTRATFINRNIWARADAVIPPTNEIQHWTPGKAHHKGVRQNSQDRLFCDLTEENQFSMEKKNLHWIKGSPKVHWEKKNGQRKPGSKKNLTLISLMWAFSSVYPKKIFLFGCFMNTPLSQFFAWCARNSLLCNARRDVNKICTSRSRTKACGKGHYSAGCRLVYDAFCYSYQFLYKTLSAMSSIFLEIF